MNEVLDIGRGAVAASSQSPVLQGGPPASFVHRRFAVPHARPTRLRLRCARSLKRGGRTYGSGVRSAGMN